MINTQDQEELFRLIADYLEKDAECIAIGGTAMMFHGYKTATKDIDLVFRNSKDRAAFISAIEKLGYSQKSLKSIYNEKRLKNRNKPLLYSRGEERFDLFVKDIFGFEIEFEKFVQRHDYIGKRELIVFTAPKEYLVLLKSVTNREKDYEDMEAIAKAEQNIDWSFIVDEAIRKRKQIPWILIDLEEKMERLRKVTFIKEEHFNKIYAAEEAARSRKK
ncbi:MAG: hypothetical protein NTV63_02935 [Candidatus Woesearchaeota archaeon]|nr:hypothetical protein [Candidatus Woesearchaeota archaeon]